MTSVYFDSLEKQEGRPYQELKAAVAALASHRMVCVYPEACTQIGAQRIQQLSAVELRKAFVTKAQVQPLPGTLRETGFGAFAALAPQRPGEPAARSTSRMHIVDWRVRCGDCNTRGARADVLQQHGPHGPLRGDALSLPQRRA
jgi:hypothetical protein